MTDLYLLLKIIKKTRKQKTSFPTFYTQTENKNI